MTKKELLQRIKGLRDDQRKQAICGLVGHSRITTYFWGYHYCGRCDEQIGDSLGSTYSGAENNLIVGHNCDTCRDIDKTLTWRDKLNCIDSRISATNDTQP